jgi:hypothetical protein
MSDGETIRRIALSLPECQEADHLGTISFRVRGKIFAQFSKDHSQVLVKLPASLQMALIGADPENFVSEPHWGSYGWTRLRLAALPAEQLRPLLIQSWRMIAPKTLARDPANPQGDVPHTPLD